MTVISVLLAILSILFSVSAARSEKRRTEEMRRMTVTGALRKRL